MFAKRTLRNARRHPDEANVPSDRPASVTREIEKPTSIRATSPRKKQSPVPNHKKTLAPHDVKEVLVDMASSTGNRNSDHTLRSGKVLAVRRQVLSSPVSSKLQKTIEPIKGKTGDFVKADVDVNASVPSPSTPDIQPDNGKERADESTILNEDNSVESGLNEAAGCNEETNVPDEIMLECVDEHDFLMEVTASGDGELEAFSEQSVECVDAQTDGNLSEAVDDGVSNVLGDAGEVSSLIGTVISVANDTMRAESHSTMETLDTQATDRKSSTHPADKLVKVASGIVHVNKRTNSVNSGFIELGSFGIENNQGRNIKERSYNGSSLETNNETLQITPRSQIQAEEVSGKKVHSDNVTDNSLNTKYLFTNNNQSIQMSCTPGTFLIPVVPQNSSVNNLNMTASFSTNKVTGMPNNDVVSPASQPNRNLMLFDVSKTSNDLLHIDKENFVCGTVCKSVYTPPGSTEVYKLDSSTYFCNYCIFRSMDRQDFISHVNKHRFHCKICKFQSFSRCKVIAHALEAHDSFPNEFDNVQYCALVQDFTIAVDLDKPVRGKRKMDATSSDSNSSAKSSKTTEQPATATNPAKIESAHIENVSGSKGTSFKIVNKDISKSSGFTKAILDGKQSGHRYIKPRPKEVAIKPNVTETGTDSCSNSADKTGRSSACNTVGLSCQVCNFLTLNDEVFTIHAKEAHPDQTMRPIHIVVTRTVAMQIGMVDSVRETEMRNGRYDWALTNTPQESPAVDLQTNDISHPLTANSSFPKTYQCQNCYGQLLDLKNMKDHLSKQHEGEIFAVKNMRSHSKKVEWFVLCPIYGCYKYFTESQNFVDHTNNCASLCQSSAEKMALDRKAINVTLQFAFSAGHKSTYSVTTHLLYQCKYCNVRCNSNSLRSIMEHVTTWHAQQIPVFINRKRFDTNFGKVFFCPKCNKCFGLLSNQQRHFNECSAVECKEERYAASREPHQESTEGDNVVDESEVSEREDIDIESG